MEWGMANRMAQLIQSDGHALFLPVDHGYFQGPTRKLEEPRKTLQPLMPYADAIFITRGVLRSCVDPNNTRPIILRVSGGTSMVGKDLANEAITTSMEEAIRLNASAVGISIFVGSNYEKESLLNLSTLVNEGERYGMPVMAVTAVGKELEKCDARYLALSCRIAAELGALSADHLAQDGSSQWFRGARAVGSSRAGSGRPRGLQSERSHRLH